MSEAVYPCGLLPVAEELGREAKQRQGLGTNVSVTPFLLKSFPEYRGLAPAVVLCFLLK